ncbi:MAG TPA: hypothetical protein VL326_01385 [Kofleriaceae bacterium]|nr:hypothetical protein [Kofleriaceae bacterium]
MQQVKQNVQIADDLALQFQSVVGRITAAAASQRDMDLSALRAESERLFIGIWEHLDAAAAHTRHAGRSTEGYATARSHTDTAVGVMDVTSEVIDVEHLMNKDVYTVRGTAKVNQRGIDSARQASAALKAAWPDVDWTPPAPMPDIDLRPRGFFARLFGR